MSATGTMIRTTILCLSSLDFSALAFESLIASFSPPEFAGHCLSVRETKVIHHKHSDLSSITYKTLYSPKAASRDDVTGCIYSASISNCKTIPRTKQLESFSSYSE